MANKDSHGVVIVWPKSGIIHRPETGRNHGVSLMQSQEWELFPSLIAAREAGYGKCEACFKGYGN